MKDGMAVAYRTLPSDSAIALPTLSTYIIEVLFANF